MSEALKNFALILGAISGWEFVKWLDEVRAKGRNKRETPTDGWDLAQRRAVRLVRLQSLVRGALPADPNLDSPSQRELREALNE